MPTALPLEVRAEIVGRREEGESFRSISEEMGLCYESVRAIWRHWQHYQSLEPRYAACRRPGPRKAKVVYEEALALKRDHPRWGAGLIRVKLKTVYPEEHLPAERTLRAWFRQAGLQRVLPVVKRGKTIRRGSKAHEVWAVDAKEQIQLEDGSQVSWMTTSDEASGAILENQVFPPEALVQRGTDPGEAGVAEPI